MIRWPCGTKFVVRTSKGLEFFTLVESYASDPEIGCISLRSPVGIFLSRSTTGATYSFGGSTWQEEYQLVQVVSVPGTPRDWPSELIMINDQVIAGRSPTDEQVELLRNLGQHELLNVIEHRNAVRCLSRILALWGNGQLLSKGELNWLKENQQFVVLARYNDNLYVQTSDPVYAACACANWRRRRGQVLT